jgi:hypothetical protein
MTLALKYNNTSMTMVFMYDNISTTQKRQRILSTTTQVRHKGETFGRRTQPLDCGHFWTLLVTHLLTVTIDVTRVEVEKDVEHERHVYQPVHALRFPKKKKNSSLSMNIQ